MQTAIKPWTAEKDAALKAAEDKITLGLIQMWQGLRDVLKDELYLKGYTSFEDYCEQRWGISRQHGYRLAKAADLVDELSPIGLQIPNERTARAILNVDPARRLPVVLAANRLSEGKLDSGWIKSAEAVVQEYQITRGFVDDGEGGMTAADAAIVDEGHERLMRKKQHIRDSYERTQGKEAFKGFVAVDYVADARGRATLFSQPLVDALKGKAGQQIYIIVYVKEDQP